MATLTAGIQHDIPALALQIANDSVRRVDRGAMACHEAHADARRQDGRTTGAVLGTSEIRALHLAIAQIDATLAACPGIAAARSRFAAFRKDLSAILKTLDAVPGR